MKSHSKNLSVIPVVLSGGSGTRLWPLSRECFPKQYLKIYEDDKLSLLQKTFKRLEGINNLDNPIIICNEEQRFLVAEQMRQINIRPNSILLEPIGRDTAPAIALAAIKASEKGEDPILLILSADHEIESSKKFVSAVNKGIFFASKGRIVTFGVNPSRAETGYGYIESYNKLSEQTCSSDIKRFIEKPNKNIAKKLILDSHFTWNSGIFLFRASIIIQELSKFEPKIVPLCKKALNNHFHDLDFQRLDISSFKSCPRISIDVAVMEKTSLGTVLLLNAGWNDIGSWKSVWENAIKDKNGNSIKGKVLIKNTENCYLRAEERLLVGVDIKNLIIIETNDAVLIADKDSSQSVKEVVKDLEKRSFKEGKVNKKIYRPWGNYTSIIESETWQVKRLLIKSKESLSLQLHNFRSEHWVVVKGIAKVEIDGIISTLNVNESIYVPSGSKHRLSNPSEELLIIIEVQNGLYLGEDDIIRFEDKYGRIINSEKD